MKQCFLISPFSSWLPNGKDNPKNYPYWQEVIDLLLKHNIKIIQIGADKSKPFNNISQYYYNLSYQEILQLLQSTDLWLAVDNFLQHLARFTEPLKNGVVIWGPSNPSLFGYEDNLNLYKDKKYFRIHQFATWFDVIFDLEGWIEPEKVVDSTLEFYKKQKGDFYNGKKFEFMERDIVTIPAV